MPQDILVTLYLQLYSTLETMASQNEQITKQNEQITKQSQQLIRQIDELKEKIAVLTQQLFGRKTEKVSLVNDGVQIELDLNTLELLNEAEYLDQEFKEEPEMEKAVPKRRKRKGKREGDLKYVESREIEHRLSEEQLAELFPHGYQQLEDETYLELEYIPAKFVKLKHVVGVYAGNRGEGIIRGDKPERLLKGSLLTPGLAAAVFTAKYVNAIPLNRLSEEFARLDVNLSRQTMSHWMISIAERYLIYLYQAMKKRLLTSRLIHCDETPFTLISDGRGPNSKNYMWVYHSMGMYGTPQIYLYDYAPTRSTSAVREFLKPYRGVLVTDGYEVYHKLAKERPEDLKVAGCWAHARRKFADLVKSLKKESRHGSISAEALRQIQAIYHVDNMMKDASEKERLIHRKDSVRPLVDAYFAWLRSLNTQGMDKSGKMYHAIQYSLNQEPYLKEFLNDPIIPLDNNDAERSIRKFCVGKHSWHVIATTRGAEASAILYSIAETAKANAVKPYAYLKYVLEQMLEHIDDPPEMYLESLLPWSNDLPEELKILINE